MTIICALHEPGVGTWIGSDRRREFDGVPVDVCTKWSGQHGKALGLSGNGRAVTILHATAERILAEPTPLDALRLMWDVLERDGFKPENNEQFGKVFRVWSIIATPESIHGIASNGCITEVPSGVFWADGSGEKQARGAAWAMMNSCGCRPEDVVRTAVRAAIANDIWCGGEPFIHLLPLGAAT